MFYRLQRLAILFFHFLGYITSSKFSFWIIKLLISCVHLIILCKFHVPNKYVIYDLWGTTSLINWKAGDFCEFKKKVLHRMF